MTARLSTEQERRIAASLERSRVTQAADQQKRGYRAAMRRRRATKAAEIIGKGNSQIAQIELCVRFVDGMKEVLKRPHPNKQSKKAARRYEKALGRVQVVIKDPHLDRFAREYFQLDEVEQLRSYCRSLAKTKLEQPKPRDGIVKSIAASEAASLLERHGLPLKVSRRSRFCRLAAVLFGDRRANLYHHCAAVKKDRVGV